MNHCLDIGLDAKVAFLSQPCNYRAETCPSRLEIIQTHMSWVFLTEHHAYKMKKPVRFSYLDFSTLEARRHDCLEELRLNRRLAANVYLDVVPLCLDGRGQLQLDGAGTPVEWLVKMQRLPEERMLDRLIREGRVSANEVRRCSAVLAGFYQRSAPVAMTPGQYCRRFAQDIQSNHQALVRPEYRLPSAELIHIHTALQSFLEQDRDLLAGRAANQKIIEAHGDLRPEHVCLTPQPVFIDCLEFKRAFRLLDPLDELAFLAMECTHAGAAFIGEILFATYHQVTGDAPPARLVAFYQAYRATLRAKLAIWHLRDHGAATHPRWTDQARAYLSLAAESCRGFY